MAEPTNDKTTIFRVIGWSSDGDESIYEKAINIAHANFIFERYFEKWRNSYQWYLEIIVFTGKKVPSVYVKGDTMWQFDEDSPKTIRKEGNYESIYNMKERITDNVVKSIMERDTDE